jgi:hypothetical protein
MDFRTGSNQDDFGLSAFRFRKYVGPVLEFGSRCILFPVKDW